ncbi:hypothetical protein [Rhizobium croatiense]|uniref:Uncharacterized protein n=1 Tax=Rhizobium croatiense TaxID=2867516 RepID=A0ABS7M813_9HYPH|nr:hypothetical protein [Rhizobium croatiense]MBY4632276.1 hypothetical protein [Rhizobium croatiense]
MTIILRSPYPGFAEDPCTLRLLPAISKAGHGWARWNRHAKEAHGDTAKYLGVLIGSDGARLPFLVETEDADQSASSILAVPPTGSLWLEPAKYNVNIQKLCSCMMNFGRGSGFERQPREHGQGKLEMRRQL